MTSFVLDNQIYPDTAIEKAITDYRKLALIKSKKDDHGTRISIFSMGIPEDTVRKEFENYLIELMQGGTK